MFFSFLAEIWKILLELSPYLFLGAALASLLKVFLPAGFVSHHIGAPNFKSVLKAVLAGVPMPLCSCGVIPAAIGLKKDGASNGAAVGFMISTPQTGLDSVLVTASFLGWPFALFTVVATFLTGLFGGQFVNWFGGRGTAADTTAPGKEGESCRLTGHHSRFYQFWDYGVNDLIGGVYRYLVVGIVAAALISLLIPPAAVANFPVLQGGLGMLAMLAVAIPLYVCTTGSVPIAASLVHAGFPIGSALVFLIAGPATNTATIGAVYRVFGRRITLIYLAVIIAGSLAFGLFFQHLFAAQGAAMAHHEVAPYSWRWFVDVGAATALSVLILRWTFLDFRSWFRKVRDGRKAVVLPEVRLNVLGMTCNKCAGHVKHDLEALPGVEWVDVRLDGGVVVVRGRALDREALVAAIEKAGYAVPASEAAR